MKNDQTHQDAVLPDNGQPRKGPNWPVLAAITGTAAAVVAVVAFSLAAGSSEADDREPVVDVAAGVTTTTEPPATTTSAPATTAEPEAPTTTQVVTTMWDALSESGEAEQFAIIGGAVGLQEDLERFESLDGEPVNRTLFAPSDDALAALGPDVISAWTNDPFLAAGAIGYLFLEEALSAEELISRDGQTLITRTEQPVQISVVDGQVLLNGTATVISSDFTAGNGVVHIVDLLPVPPE